MSERVLSIVVQAKNTAQAARDIGKVDTAVSNVGKNGVGQLNRLDPATQRAGGWLGRVRGGFEDIGNKARSGVDTAVGKINGMAGPSATMQRNIGLLGGALQGLANFLPPDLKPFAYALEDINRATGGGIGTVAGKLATTALQQLKIIQANTVTLVGKTLTGAGVPGASGASGLGLTALIAGAAAPAAAAIATGILADQFNNDPARQQNGISGTLQPLFNPFDFPGLFANLGTLGEVAGKAIDQLQHPGGPTAQTGGLSPDDRQILSDQKRATDALSLDERQAARDATAASNREIAAQERTRFAIQSLALKPPSVSVLVGGTVVNVSAQSISTSQTTVSTWTGSTKYATAV